MLTRAEIVAELNKVPDNAVIIELLLDIRELLARDVAYIQHKPELFDLVFEGQKAKPKLKKRR